MKQYSKKIIFLSLCNFEGSMQEVGVKKAEFCPVDEK